MSTDLIKFIEIRNLFLNIPNNNYQFKKNYNLTIEEEIVCQLLIFISTILKNKISNCEIELKKQIITESLIEYPIIVRIAVIKTKLNSKVVSKFFPVECCGTIC
jgi:hypothetical protein